MSIESLPNINLMQRHLTPAIFYNYTVKSSAKNSTILFYCIQHLFPKFNTGFFLISIYTVVCPMEQLKVLQMVNAW